MKTLLRWLFGLLAAAVLLAVAVIIAVLLFVDPNNYRDEIAVAVKAQTGRDLAIKGDLGLDLLPCCGIQLGRTSLSNPPGFDAPEFARVEGIRLGLQLWPLLTRRQLIIGEVELNGLDLALVRRADGKDNWSFTAADEAAAEPAAPGAEPGLTLSVAGIRVVDSRVAYRDEVQKADYQLDALELSTGEVAPGVPFDVDTSFRVLDATTGTSLKASLTAVANLDLDAQRARFDNIDTQLELAGKELPAGTVKLSANIATLDYDLEAGAAKLAGIDGRIALSGDPLPAGSVDMQMQLAQLDFQVDSGAATLNDLTTSIEARGEPLPADGLDATLRLAGVTYNVDSGAGKLNGLEGVAKTAGAELRLDGGGVLRDGSPELQGQFQLPAGSPRDWLAALGEPAPATTDPAVLTLLESSGRFALTDDSIALDDLTARLDDTRLTGELAVSHFAAPRVRIALVADSIDLDRYFAPADDNAKGREDEVATELPREELRDLTLDGTVRVGALKIADMRLEQVQATAQVRDGVLTLAPLTAMLYGGRYDGSIRLDGSGEQAQVQLKQSLDAVQVGRLLTDLADVEQLEGLVVANIDLTGSGRTDADLRRNLAGTVSFELADGVYKGMDIWQEIRAARAMIRGERPPPRTGPAQTRITAMDFAGQIANGKLTSERLVTQIPFLRITGDGALDLSDENLDYRFKARVLQAPEFPDGERLKDLEGWTIPLLLTGTLDQPKVGVDLAEFAKTRAAEQIRDTLLDKLGLEQKKAPAAPSDAPAGDAAGGAPADTGEPAAPEQPEPEQAPPEEKKKPESPEDILKRGLKDLIGR